MKYRVIAVVVTCNRCELLKKSIDALLESAFSLYRIVVVNNASTDGTKQYLDSLRDERIIKEHRDINEGGAGGFYYGVKTAYEIGCDFIWLMDDDTIVTPFALSELMSGYEKLWHRNIGFLASNALWKDGKPCLMNICSPCYEWNEYASDGLVRVSHCSFVSMLIPSWVVKEVGYPIKEYFIWGDDGEYSTRILRKYEGYLCGKSIVYHYMNDNVGVDIYNIESNRIDRFYYFYRNWMCTHRMRSSEDAKRYIQETRKLIKEVLKSNTSHKFKKAKTIARGLKDGKKFKVSINYPFDSNVKSTEADQSLKKRNVLFRIIRFWGIKYDIWTKGNIVYLRELDSKYIRLKSDSFHRFCFWVKGLLHIKRFDSGDKTKDFDGLLRSVKFEFCNSNYFAYSIDVFKTWKISFRQMGNCTPNYELLLKSGLSSLLMDGKDSFALNNNKVIDSISTYIDRMNKKICGCHIGNRKQLSFWLMRIKDKPAESFEECLQRILFLNQLLWQTRHIQIGLGRLDVLLADYVSDEYTDEYIVSLLKDFLKILHEYFWLKSEEMLGDTGQIIVLGGIDKDGNNVDNRLTRLFIVAVKELQIPDPKILLRTNGKTSDDLLELASECIATGIGCPIIANDDKVLPLLYDFGYSTEDSNNYVTSACWEIIPGNCCEQNNIGVFDFAETFDLLAKKENLEELDSWEKFIGKFADNLCGHIWFMANLTQNIKWEKDPLLSSFINSCRESRADISEGGCKYNNYGILSLGLANTVNSLINIRKYVYKEKKYTIKDLYIERNMNFPNKELRHSLLISPKLFGDDTDSSEDVLGLTNWLIGLADEVLDPLRNKFGGKFKFGLSSPGYIVVGKHTGATFDGRLDHEPYSIHISNDSLNTPTSLTNFAGKLLYGKNGFNGDVVDLTFPQGFVNDNIKKFISFIKGSIKAGVFELQINVLDYDTLIKAKNNPEKFPDLIVRVWGFSAYFKDIPEEYQEYIIERARQNAIACQ